MEFQCTMLRFGAYHRREYEFIVSVNAQAIGLILNFGQVFSAVSGLHFGNYLPMV